MDSADRPSELPPPSYDDVVRLQGVIPITTLEQQTPVITDQANQTHTNQIFSNSGQVLKS